MSEQTGLEPEDTTTEPAGGSRRPERDWRTPLREAAAGPVVNAVLALLLAFLIGSLLIIFTDDDVRPTLSYVTARPGDFFSAAWEAIRGAYTALFQGAVYNTNLNGFGQQIRPLTETLNFAAPLILAGLGVGVAFRAGLFNIGGRGQMLIGAVAATYVAVSWDLPVFLHLPLAVVAGAVGGAVWAGIAGLLKARTGAHEVIVTIMLNYVGYYLVFYLLSRQGLLQRPDTVNPVSSPIPDSATLPLLLGEKYRLHLGFLLALAAVAVVWWLLNRSALGFRFRTVGENPAAARAAGIDVGRTYTIVMVVAGALVGLAGVNQVLGTDTSGTTPNVDSGIGFDAITVALLGRSRPLGVLAAGLLFGALKSGGYLMESAEGIPKDIVLIVQALIVLFIAAPPLVRTLFRLPAQEDA